MKSHLTRTGMAVVAIAIASVSVAGSAQAHSDDSRITLGVSDRTVRKHQDVTFFGRLGNEHRSCERGASVVLIRKNSGVVARDTTDAEGEFFFRIDPKPNHGRYFARYAGEGRFGYAGSHSCGADRSRGIRIRRS